MLSTFFTRRWLPKRKLKIYCDPAVTKFATLGEFLVCRLSLPLPNIEIYRQRGLKSNIVGYLLLSYIKGFHVAVVEIRKTLQPPSSDSTMPDTLPIITDYEFCDGHSKILCDRKCRYCQKKSKSRG